MPISTDLNRNPYWNDYSPKKLYYKELFKPSVSVQTRELNALQDQVQHQIESFGDNIFTTGTIVSGCNFQYYNPYPYVKLNDLDVFNIPIVPKDYVGLNVLNQSTGQLATILNSKDGFQTTDPDLKTLYIRYNNVGNTGANLTSFHSGDVLTVYDPVVNGVEKVIITDGGISFSNSNVVVALSSIIVTLTSGSAPLAGTFLNNGNGLTNVQIMTISSLPTANQYLIGIAPRTVDLANSQCNSQYWTFKVSDTLTNPGATLTLSLNQIIGSGFQASIITDGVGTIINVPIRSKGVGYSSSPFITVQSFNNSVGYATLSLAPQTFVTQCTVASTSNSVGNGYAFGVTQGIIYQKGYFLDVVPQIILIDNYSQSPDNVAVGFITNEQIIDFNTDQSLVDNANGQSNFQAPGADRLQLTPQLIVQDTANAIANAQFQVLVQWKEGQPYLQQQQTIYSTIGAEMAQHIEDASGDFVVDPFVITTRSPLTSNQEGKYFNVVIDPGEAYISGYKVATVDNFNINDNKGTDTGIVKNHAISLNYGNYLFINNVAGAWTFNTGASVDLYDTAKNYYSNFGNNLNPTGNKIGVANMRSILLNQGAPGQATTTYRLYLFNVSMNAGFNFANVCAVSYAPSGTNTAIADVVLLPASNVNSNVAILQDVQDDQLLFYSGVTSLKNANNVSYTYRTANAALTTSNGNASAATLVIDMSSGTETFPYGQGSLSSTQLQDFLIVPTADLLYNAAITGTISTSPGSNTVNGTSTGFFSNLVIGDYVYVSSNASGGHDLRQITGITNNTSLQLNSPSSYTNAVATLIRCYPANMPIPFGFRSDLTGNVNVNDNIITLNYGRAFSGSGSTTTFGAYNVSRSDNPVQLTKTANRQVYVKIQTNTHPASNTGPWSLGVPDVFRLRAIYIGNSSITNTGSNWVSSFYVGTNQNADFYGLSNLYIKQGANPPVPANTYMLVCFDYFTSSGVGYYDTVSYLQSSTNTTIFTQDSLPLANLTTFVNSYEVPELFTDDGTEIDLLSYIDFRPYVANTVNPTTNSTIAPTNPANTVSLSVTGGKKFPLPSSTFVATLEGWQGRIDSLFLDKNGQFTISEGFSNSNFALCRPPVQPVGSMKLVDIAIPPYPNLPINPSGQMQQILQTNIVSNKRFLTTRINNTTIYNLAANSAVPFNQPSVYTMAEIGNIDRRLKQVEYIITLNTLEANATGLQIPSSVVAGQTRVAYGVFADDFSTANLSAIDDPEYQAIKQGTNIVPTKMLWDLALAAGTVPYVESPIINQPQATIGGVTDPLGLGPVCALNLANTVAYTQVFRNAADLGSGVTVDNFNITMADANAIANSISSVAGSLNDFLLNNTYTPYTGLQSYTLGKTRFLANTISTIGAGQGGQNLIDVLNSVGFTTGTADLNKYAYDPATQTLVITGGADFSHSTHLSSIGTPYTLAIQGISQTVANAFAQAYLGTITWNQFFSMLNVTGQVPSGGTTTGGIYNPPVAFFFYNYDQGVKYEIYQGTTLVASSDPGAGVPTCQNLNASDIALLEGSAAQYWFNDQPELFMKNFGSLGSGYVNYAGKILFNYDSTKGSHFTIKTTESISSFKWRWTTAYPINGKSVGCVPPVGSISPIYTTYNAMGWCGNGAESLGKVTILSGFTETWNSVSPITSTAIIPFNSTQDWL